MGGFQLPALPANKVRPPSVDETNDPSQPPVPQEPAPEPAAAAAPTEQPAQPQQAAAAPQPRPPPPRGAAPPPLPAGAGAGGPPPLPKTGGAPPPPLPRQAQPATTAAAPSAGPPQLPRQQSAEPAPASAQPPPQPQQQQPPALPPQHRAPPPLQPQQQQQQQQQQQVAAEQQAQQQTQQQPQPLQPQPQRPAQPQARAQPHASSPPLPAGPPPSAAAAAAAPASSISPPPATALGAPDAVAPPLPPPQTPQELEVARSMLSFLLEELSPTVFTRKKDALEVFDNYYFKILPAYTTEQVKQLVFGSSAAAPQEKNKGLYALCGTTSWKHSGLKQAAQRALGLLAKFCDITINPHAQTFLQVFISSDVPTLRLLRLDKHLSTPRGHRHAATFLLSVLKNFNRKLYDAMQTDLASQLSAEDNQALKRMKHDMLAKRISMRCHDKDIIAKQLAYGGKGGPPPPPQRSGNAGPSRGPPPQPAQTPGATAEKQGIKSRLLAFFGSRPSPAEMEKRGLIKAKSYGVALDDLYKNPALIEPFETSMHGTVQVPVVLAACARHMVNAGIIEMQGVFRLSGDSLEIGATKDKFDAGVAVDLEKVGPHSVSGLVKLFLRNLPQPLLTFEAYDDFVAAFRADRFDTLSALVSSGPGGKLSAAHQQTFVFLMDFLSKVNAYAETNMMTDTNISICIAPNILRPKVETYEKVAKDTPITIGVVKYLLNKHAAKMKEQGHLNLPRIAGGNVAATKVASAAASRAASPVPAHQAAAERAASPVPAAAAAARAASPVAMSADVPASAAASRAASPPVSPRGGRPVLEEYSSTSAEAVAAAAAAPKEVDAEGNPIEAAPPKFAPTAAQYDLANAMSAAMANRAQLKSRGPPPLQGQPAQASTTQPQQTVQLKKVTPRPADTPSAAKVAGGALLVGAVVGGAAVAASSSSSSSSAPAPAASVDQPQQSQQTSVDASASSSSSSSAPSAAVAEATTPSSTNSNSSTSSSSSQQIPEHYERFRDPASGKYYYYNKLTSKVTWRRPDMLNDALDSKDAKQIFPPQLPAEAPPVVSPTAQETPSVAPIRAPIDESAPHTHSSSTSDIAASDLPSILPAPPRQPRRMSHQLTPAAGSQGLLSPPPALPKEATIVEEEDDASAKRPAPIATDAAAATSASSAPAAAAVGPVIPNTPPPAFDDDDDMSIPISGLDLPPAPMPPAAIAAQPAQPEPAVYVPVSAQVEPAAAVPVAEAAEPAVAEAPAIRQPSPAAPTPAAAAPAVAPAVSDNSAASSSPVVDSVPAPAALPPARPRLPTYPVSAKLAAAAAAPTAAATAAPVAEPAAASSQPAPAPAVQPSVAIAVANPTPVAAAPVAAAAAATPAVAAAAAPEEDDAQVEEDEEWDEFTDPVSGKAYFCNKKTQKTTWTNPFTAAKLAASAAKEAAALAAEAAAAAAVPASSTTSCSAPFASPLYGGWQSVSIRGRWDADSAAGCYPNYPGWARNPQYHVGINTPPAVEGKKTQVVIQLQWEKLKRVGPAAAPASPMSAGSSGEDHIAGFYVLINNGPSYQKLFIHADEVVARSDFENKGSVVVNMLLDSFSLARPPSAEAPSASAGAAFVKNYILVPSTFEPGYAGDFTLTIHSANPGWIAPVSAKERWVETSVNSQWLGDTAGGCRNHAATFPLNPQFRLTSSVADRPTPVLCLLSQLSQSLPDGSQAPPHPIGWYAINAMGKIEAKGPFQANMEVHNQFDLQPASCPYVLVPCTFAPALEGKFTLSLFTPPHAKLTLTPVLRV